MTTGDYLPGYAKWRASGRFPAFVRREALHEAAHAIIAEALDAPVLFVTLGARRDSEYSHPLTRHVEPSYQVWRRHERVAIVALAGHAADGRDWRRVRDAEGCGDRAGAREAAERVTDTRAERDALLDHLWAVARWLVKRNRRAIDRLAAELLAEETITGARVRAILEAVE